MPAAKLDLAFDARVADQYDAQRRHPEEVARRIGEAIAGLARHGRVLELGAGTGRIALPVGAAGCEVVGVDLSERMLARLRERAGIAGPAAVRADVAALPFRPASFDAVLAVHVLHLVEDWATVLRGAAATLRPGSAFILGRDWIDPASMAGQVQHQFRRIVMALGPKLKPPAGRTVNEFLKQLGAEPEPADGTEQVAAEWQAELAPAELIAAIGDREYAESWPLPDEILRPAVERLTAWARAQWSDLDAPQPVRKRFLLAVFRGDFDHGN